MRGEDKVVIPLVSIVDGGVRVPMSDSQIFYGILKFASTNVLLMYLEWLVV